MFEQSRIRLNKWLLSKRLQKQNILRSSVSLEEAQKVGLLVNAVDDMQLKAALELADRLKKQKKKVEVLVFTGKSNSAELAELPQAYQVFGFKDLDWALRPKDGPVSAFMAQPFDLLFYFSQKSEPVLDYIMALSAARFRIGPFNESAAVCDLMVVPERADANAFASLMLFYLEKLNPRHSPEQQTMPTQTVAS